VQTVLIAAVVWSKLTYVGLSPLPPAAGQITLGVVDAAYSGDWSRIGAISKGGLSYQCILYC
jgi:hypothetical protein